MAYCVKCGVELAATEKKCPLCGTKVILPEGMVEEKGSAMYPVHVPSIHMEFRELLPALAVLLLLPAAICIICDMLIAHKLTWSVYVLISNLLAYAYIFPPFFYKNNRTIKSIITSTCATCLGLFAISLITTAPKEWFFSLALPICLFVCALIVAVILIFKRMRLNRLAKTAVVLFTVALLTLFINILVNLFYGMENLVSWSLYSFVPCVIIGIVVLMLSKNTKFKSEAKRRFFV